MRIRPRRSVSLSVSVVFLSAALTTPGVLAADLPSNLFAFESSGSYVGQPESVTETGATASMIFAGLTAGDPAIRVTVYAATTVWDVWIRPPAGQQLAVGSYPNADAAAPSHPELRITGGSRACNQVLPESAFEIHELTRDAAGRPTSLALSFRMSCDSDFGTMVGRLRMNSIRALASMSVPHASRYFGGVALGDSVMRTYSIAANGDLPVRVTGVSIGGVNSADFGITDRCGGKTLQPGAACDFDVRFAPLATGDRTATVTITHDGALSPETLPVIGAGQIATTTTVGLEPDTTYFSPGVLYVGTVTPNPAAGEADIYIDGELVHAGVSPQGRTLVARPRVTGSHTLQVHYLGIDTHAASWSPLQTFVISNTTTTTLSPASGAVATGSPVTFTATVATASDLLYPGGTMTIRDMTLGRDLASGPVTRSAPTLTVTTTLAAGTHDIRARYSGVTGVLNSSSRTNTFTVGAQPTPTPTPTPTATPAPTGTPSGTTLTFASTADAYVKSSSPTSNYGTDTSLRLRLGDPSNDITYRSYIRFDIAGLSGRAVTSAKLRLAVTDAGPHGGTVYRTATGWTETGITYANGPASTGGALAAIGSVTSGQVVDVPLPPGTITADGPAAFVLIPGNSNSVYYTSRQGAQPPQLILDIGSGSTPTPTPAATSAPTPTPTAAPTPTPTPTPTAAPTPTPTPTPAPTANPTPAPTSTPPGGSRIKDITFEGGLLDPTSGFDSLTSPVTLETTAPIRGMASARCASSTGYLQETFAPTDDAFVSFRVRLSSIPTGSPRVFFLSNGGTTVGNLLVTTTGRLRLRNGSTTVGADSAALTVGTTYRVGVHQRRGSGANAVLEAFLVPDGTAFGAPFASSSTGSWTTAADRLRLGATNSTAVDLIVDDVFIGNGSMPT